MSEAPLHGRSPLERWTKEAGEVLRKKGWKNLLDIQTFWSNREMNKPEEIERIIEEIRGKINPKEFKEFQFFSNGRETIARMYNPTFQHRVADLLAERFPAKKAKIEKARLKIPALDESE